MSCCSQKVELKCMPRVTHATYRKRHLHLRQLWTEHEGVFSRVSPGEQWALHNYYLCAKRMTGESLHQHYLDIQAAGSSLPQRAGKAYAQLSRELTLPLTVRTVRVQTKRRAGEISLQPLARPQIDIDRLAKMLIRLARESILTEESEDSTADGPRCFAA